MRSAVAESSQQPSKAILIVDDNEDIRDALGAYLQLEGFETFTAHDGAAAMHLLQRGEVHPCLILLDYNMPVLDGVGFRRLQMADPGLSEIPVVLYSGAHDIRAKARELDVPHVFQKPLDLHAVVALAHRHCNGSRDT